MAHFNTAYGLCSLIDQKGFLHVSPDEEKSAILTLGRNIIIRYRLADQKQLNSWSTILKVTSPVVYNEVTNEYLAIFSKNIVKIWTSSESNLEKVKKIKLKYPAREILIHEGQPIILFESGACCKLSSAESKSFTPPQGFVQENSVISYAKIGSGPTGPCLFVVTTVNEKKSVCQMCRLEPNVLQPIISSLREFTLKRTNHTLVGSCLVSRRSGEVLVSFWSDGFLYGKSVQEDNEGLGQFYGTLHTISTKTDVALQPLSSNHIAVYGGDPAEEGAVLAIYNLDFCIVQAHTAFKYLQTPARLWVAHDRLMLCVGMRLVCVPFTLQTGSVSALVGSRSVSTEISSSDLMAVVPTVDWEGGSKSTTAYQDVPPIVMSLIDSLAAQGFSESAISEHVIKSLIEKEDITSICWCFENFIDLPEHLILSLLNLALVVPKEILKKCDGLSDCAIDELNPVQPPERVALLGRIFSTSLNSSKLTTTLRKCLNLDSCLLLLKFFTYQLSNNRFAGEFAFVWASSLVEAFYPQFLLLKEPETKGTLEKLMESVDEEIRTLDELQGLVPFLLRIQAGKEPMRKSMQSSAYSIVSIKLYK